MEKKKVIVIGCGDRGRTYTDIMKDEFSDCFEVVAVAEPVAARRNYMKEKHNLPDELCFESWEPLLELPKMADVAIIATMDKDHYGPAMKALDLGYPLLLEKPIAPTPEECVAIAKKAEEKNLFVIVCHVLRYTAFFMALKDIIESGEIGKVMAIQHIEGVGNVHQSHSFVRGNWGQSAKSSSMLLQKTCHDMDIMAWLAGEKCTAVQSFGKLSYFCEKNAPAGAPARCIDGCPEGDRCPYNAVKLYVEDNEYSDWFRRTSAKCPNPTREQMLEVMRTTDYGRCVFRSDNDVVDHQVVNLQFGDDVFADFSMSAFTKGGRCIRIMGTEGEINAKMEGNTIDVYSFITSTTRRHDCNTAVSGEMLTGGHGGGDTGIVKALYDTLMGEKCRSVCSVRESCDNHLIVFAAEHSRHTGTVVSLAEYEASLAEKN
ncbi:MAG: Gfo/Idh/MocA family oxidoreductase [Clostridia bacterium]|nr:Gfo/Idh/MocA family oxidoreductase [Clostridia bacterium]